MQTPTFALNNLRTFAVMMVLAVHACSAYLGSSPASPFRFDDPPFRWRALPIIDGDRFFGFDIFCGYHDTYLITLLFFVSGLFVWPSLARKGTWYFLRDRIVRIAVPFALAVGLLIPLAYYPVYAVTAVDPSPQAYWQHWLALPLWPSGPPWFLWVLLIFDLCAAALYRFARGACQGLSRVTGWLGARPKAFITVALAASALAYVPPALAFTPWAWFQAGPFAFQECRPLLYAVWFFAGVGLGGHGIERGLLAPGGWLVRHWQRSGWAALSTFALWLTFAALANTGTPSRAVRVLEAFSYVPCCTASCLFMLAVFLRFANRPVGMFDPLCDKAYGMYLVHYLFSVWLQFLLLGLVVPGGAAAKAAIVFCGTVAMSFGTVALIQRVLAAARDERKRSQGMAMPS